MPAPHLTHSRREGSQDGLRAARAWFLPLALPQASLLLPDLPVRSLPTTPPAPKSNKTGRSSPTHASYPLQPLFLSQS